MKVTSLNGAVVGFDHGIGKINAIIYEILSELGVTVSEVNLVQENIPYYDGTKSLRTENIIQGIRESNGLIFTTTATLGAPSAPLLTFMEHLDHPDFFDAISKKNCLLLIVSAKTGERQALEYISRAINLIGGFDSVKICLNSRHLKEPELDPSIREIIEKQIEDFYRIVRQNRKYIIPDNGFYVETQALVPSAGPFTLTVEEQSNLQSIEKRKKVPLSEIVQDLGLDSLDKRQEQDINEITQFFATKYSESKNEKKPVISFEPSPIKQPQSITPRIRTVKQYTAGLPHYFNSQLSGDLNACIQISISGSEKFDGYLLINNTECLYFDGMAEKPDITILSDATVWLGVLKGKYTAQKSFMIGQLKVRGNFVLLSKFDQLFKDMA